MKSDYIVRTYIGLVILTDLLTNLEPVICTDLEWDMWADPLTKLDFVWNRYPVQSFAQSRNPFTEQIERDGSGP